MTTANHTPSATPALPVRRHEATFGEHTVAHWAGGDAALTHVLNTYTLLVPDNEGFYIRTLSQTMPKLADPALERQVHDFVRQEGQHGVGHRKMWKVLEKQGYRFMSFVKGVAAVAYGPMEKFLPLWLRTSMVAAIEHTNAYIGREFLAHEILRDADPEMRSVFEWHFAEEIEHRSVAFDVLKKLKPSYAARVVGAVLTFPLFYIVMTIGMLNLMRQDGSLTKSVTWKHLWAHLWSRDRMIQRTLRHIGNYLKPSFHPSQMADDALAAAAIARWSSKLHDVATAPMRRDDAVVPTVAPLTVPAHAVSVARAALAAPAAFAGAVAELTGAAHAKNAASDRVVAAARQVATPAVFEPGSIAARVAGNDHVVPARALSRLQPQPQGVTGIAVDYGFNALRVVHDGENSVHWCYMHPAAAASEPGYRACFHTTLIREICEYQKRLGVTLNHATGEAKRLPHVVLASDSDVFNLGGDLALFSRLIRSRDRDGLFAYAKACVEGVHAFHAGLDAGVHSIALVRGDALGGGFEAALSCHTIIAEEGSGMGLPEVLFDLFPGMGAFSFLSRRVGESQAEKMMLSGDVYRVEELHRMGIVDVLVPRGHGEAAVMEVVKRNQRIPNARLAMHRVRESVAPVTLDELMRVTNIWVDTAMQLRDKSLRTMERLVRAQLKRNGNDTDGAVDTRAG